MSRINRQTIQQLKLVESENLISDSSNQSDHLIVDDDIHIAMENIDITELRNRHGPSRDDKDKDGNIWEITDQSFPTLSGKLKEVLDTMNREWGQFKYLELGGEDRGYDLKTVYMKKNKHYLHLYQGEWKNGKQHGIGEYIAVRDINNV